MYLKMVSLISTQLSLRNRRKNMKFLLYLCPIYLSLTSEDDLDVLRMNIPGEPGSDYPFTPQYKPTPSPVKMTRYLEDTMRIPNKTVRCFMSAYGMSTMI